MKFEFTARKRGDGEEYFPIKEHGLMVGIQEKGGNGTPDNPILFSIKTNKYMREEYEKRYSSSQE